MRSLLFALPDPAIALQSVNLQIVKYSINRQRYSVFCSMCAAFIERLVYVPRLVSTSENLCFDVIQSNFALTSKTLKRAVFSAVFSEGIFTQEVNFLSSEGPSWRNSCFFRLVFYPMGEKNGL